MPHPDTIGPYPIESELGRGSNGVVFLGRHPTLPRRLAIKVLLGGREAGETAIRRFHLEAEILGRLDHPGLVRAFDTGWHKNHCYFVMDYVPGPTLRERLKQGGPLPPEAARALILGLARTMSYAHAEGVVHRDLKPSNIILADSGPQITDFGLARDARAMVSDLTRTGDILGTPLYMSPEQLESQRDLDARVDVYALGLILYECLTGQHPFMAPTIPEVAERIQEGWVPPLSEAAPGTPPDLEAICVRAMARARDHRFADAGDLAAALAAETSVELFAPPPAPRHRRLWPLAVGALAALLVLVSFASWQVLQRRRAGEALAEAQRSLQDGASAAQVQGFLDSAARLGADDVKIAEHQRRLAEREARARQEAQANARLARARDRLSEARTASRAEAPAAEVLSLLEQAELAARGDPALRDEIQLELVSSLFRRGRFGEASERGDALASKPGRIGLQARYVAAFGRIWRDQVPEGLRELEGIWTENPDDPVGLNAGAVFHSYTGKNPKGEVLARRSIALDPDYVDPYMSLAFCLNDQGKWDEALEVLREAERLQPDHPRLYMAQAFANGNLRRRDEALQAYGRVIELTMPTPMPRALRHRMDIWRQRRRYRELREDGDLLLRQAPDDALALFYRGLAAERLGDLHAARVDWRRARRVDPQTFEGLLRQAGDYARHVRDLIGRQ